MLMEQVMLSRNGLFSLHQITLPFKKLFLFGLFQPLNGWGGGGQFGPPSCGFLKSVSSGERVRPCFFVTFNIILSRTFPDDVSIFLLKKTTLIRVKTWCTLQVCIFFKVYQLVHHALKQPFLFLKSLWFLGYNKRSVYELSCYRYS